MEPKPRPVRIPIHVLAYFGDYMNQFDESIKKMAQQAAQAKREEKYSKPLNTSAPKPDGR